MEQETAQTRPSPGDLIEISRGLFNHWAVYVGDGYVVHLVNLDSGSLFSASSSSNSQTTNGWGGKVKRQKLKVVVGKDSWQVNNKLDDKQRARPANEIVEKALSMVGEDKFYHVTMRNCEHFAMELRYDISTSSQVMKYAAVGVAALVGGALGSIAGPRGTVGGASALALYVKSKLDQ